MMRLSIDQTNHKPAVYHIEQDELIYLPIESDVFDFDLSTDMTEREERISSFVSYLKTDYRVSVIFEKNLVSFMKTNKVIQAVQDLVLEFISDGLNQAVN